MAPAETPADEGGSNDRPSRLRQLAVGVAGVAILAAALVLWLRPWRTVPVIVHDVDEDIERLLTVENPGYVGIGVCAECHVQRAADFKTTRHYIACTAASGVTAPGFKAGHGRFDTKIPGLHFDMTRKGDEFFIAAVEDDHPTNYQIGLVYGSASKRDEMYFAWKGDRLYHLPVAWLFPFQCWGTTSDTMDAVPAGPSCLQCHNTWMAHVPGTLNQYHRDQLYLGVTCERCHGPGKDHVEHHRKQPKSEAKAILHPGTLGRERLMDVCAQCHGNTRIVGKPFSFRPGQPLDTGYRTVKAKFREDDTTTNQVQYLSESKCYQKSQMTCITCHDPHYPRPSHAGCMLCHTAASCTDQPNQPVAVRGDCVGCHMPQRNWMNSHFYTTKDDRYLPVGPRPDHRIGVYPQAKKAVVLAWLRQQADAKSKMEAVKLAAELSKHWLSEAEDFSSAGRLKAAIGAFREALQIVPNPVVFQQLQGTITRQVELDDLFAKLTDTKHADKAILILKNILDLRPDDARAHGELGRVYVETGQHAKAIPHLHAVAKYDPSDSSGLTRLAWIADLEGRPDEAATLCAQADKIEPAHPLNHFVWGMALLKQKRWQEAEVHFRTVLKTSLTHAGANRGLSESLRQQGQAKEAVIFARRAVHWGDAKNAELFITLADAYAAASRVADARETLKQALEVAQMFNPALVSEIHRRLDEIQ